MRKALKLLLFTDSWANLGLAMIGPIYAIFVEEIGGNILDASWAYFAFMLTTGLVMLIIGKWEDRSKHVEKFLIASYALTSVGFLSYIFVESQAHLVATQIVLGIATAINYPTFDTMYTKLLDVHKEASEWADYEALNNILIAFGALIGGFIAFSFGFKILFVVMFAISLVSLALAVAWVRRRYI